MAKHLVEIDERILEAARAQPGTKALEDTIAAALRRAAGGRERRIAKALDTLARANLGDRDDAWR